MTSLKGFLIDLDGVLYVENELIPGAAETVNWLRQAGHPFRFLTNTTIRSRTALQEKLTGLGIETRAEEIFSTCVVAARWLKQREMQRIHFLLPEEPLKDFTEFEITDRNPDAVVVGDLGKNFNYDVLNRAFRLLKQGAQLVALQKNRFWQTLDGLAMDVGAFVAALEYAAHTEAVVIGKPNRAYFEMALNDMELPAAKVAMVGDDLCTDIKGGRETGLKTILVKTGKFQFDTLSGAEVEPDWIIDSIADLPGLLGSKNRSS